MEEKKESIDVSDESRDKFVELRGSEDPVLGVFKVRFRPIFGQYQDKSSLKYVVAANILEVAETYPRAIEIEYIDDVEIISYRGK